MVMQMTSLPEFFSVPLNVFMLVIYTMLDQ